MPEYRSQLFRVVTEFAPWNDAEGWRRHSYSDPTHDQYELSQVNPLEGDATSIEEPDRLDIWLEPGACSEDGRELVGMALRGRWALFGVGDSKQWWAFKAKDCQSTSAHTV